MATEAADRDVQEDGDIPEVVPIRVVRNCGHCRKPGHRIETCPDLSPYQRGRGLRSPPPMPTKSTIARVAELRERADALTTEISQYEALLEEIRHRISRDRREREDIFAAITRLRGMT